MNRIPIMYKTPMTMSLFHGLPVILSDDIVKTVSDHALLLEKSKFFPTSSSTNLFTGLWLGRACGRGGEAIWAMNYKKNVSRSGYGFSSWGIIIIYIILIGLCFFVLVRLMG